MSYTISPSDDDRYIIVEVRNEINRAKAMLMNLEAHALGRKRGIHRYFVDLTEAKNTDSIQNNYEFAYSDMNRTEGIDRFARVAALVSPDDHSHDFLETVVRNSGLNMKLFTDRNLALQYLLNE